MALVNLMIIAISFNLLGPIHCAPPPGPPPSAPFSYAVVAFQWPMALCATSSRPCTTVSRPENFRLHGVWPTNAGGSPVTCTTESPFVYSQIKDIASMNSFWPNYFGPNKEFWKSQWDKHGVCSGQSVGEYFENSLSLFRMNSNKILTSLRLKGIKPVRGTDLRGAPTVDLVYNALSEGLGLIPMLYCTSLQGNRYLVEVRLCANPDLKGFGDCPEDQYVSCGSAEQKMLFYAE